MDPRFAILNLLFFVFLRRYNALSIVKEIDERQRDEEVIVDLVPLLVNGWRAYGAEFANPRARKFQGTVYLEGLIRHDNPLPGLIATLPIEFRLKAGRMIFTASQHTASEHARIDVLPNGDIILGAKEGNSVWIALNNVAYRV